MREQITIPLRKPLKTPEGEVKAIIIREPSFDEYMAFGDPYTVAGSADGTPFAVENADVIKQYFAVCLVQPKDPALLSQAGAVVARTVVRKLLSFFQDAETDSEGSGTSQTS